MTTDLTSFDTLTPETVETARQRVRGFLASFRPDVDAVGGLVGSLVVELTSVTLAAVDDRIDTARQNGSLLAASENPDAFDADSLDALVSNFRITRLPGRKATGSVSLVVRSLIPVSVPAGFAFRAGSGTFVTPTAFAGRVSADQVVTDADRLLAPTADGRFAFQVDVEATAEGPVGLISRSTPVIPQASITGVVEAYAADDFVGGLDQETNAQLVQRALTGVSGRGPANRLGLTALITQDQTVGPLLSALSVIGFGDEEQTRYHGLRPIAHGGRCDVYVRPAGGPTDITYEVTAALVGFTDGVAGWAFTLAADRYGGGYAVQKVAATDDPSDAGLDVTDTVTSWEPADTIDIETAEEAVYSALQTVRVEFADPSTDTATAVGTTRTAYATVRRAKGTTEAHALVQADDNRPTAGDVLVRAAVPCFVRFGVVVAGPPTKTADVDAAQAAVAAVLDRSGFTGRLYASQLVAAVNDALDDDQSVTDWTLTGVITAPDGTRLLVGDKSGVSVPWRPDLGITFRTTAFYLPAENLAFTYQGVET